MPFETKKLLVTMVVHNYVLYEKSGINYQHYALLNRQYVDNNDGVWSVNERGRKYVKRYCADLLASLTRKVGD